MPKTKTITDVEIFATGVWNGDPYSRSDLDAMVAAHGQVGFDTPVKLGHMDDKDTKALLKAEGMPAFGWVKNLRVKGEKLLADFVDVPSRLAEIIQNKGYKPVSSEVYWDFNQGDKTFPRVLKAVALLGAEIPAVTDIKGIEALYKNLGIGLRRYDEEENEYRTYFYGGEDGMYDERFKKTKGIVNYRLAEGGTERCGLCRFYFGPSETGSIGACSLVQGEIFADAVCDLFEPREALIFPDTAQDSDAAMSREYVIKKRGDQYCLMTSDGKETLGCHDTKAGAEAQERAIKARQNMSFDDIVSTLRTYQKGIQFVIGKLKGQTTTTVQSVLFDIEEWTEKEAKAWLKENDFKFGNVEKGEERLRFKQLETADFQKDSFKNIDAGDRKASLTAGGIHGHSADSGSTMTIEQKVYQELADLKKERDDLKEKIAALEKKIKGLEAKENTTELTREVEHLTAQLKEQTDRTAKIEEERRREKVVMFVDRMVREGKILPKDKGQTVTLLCSMDDVKTVTFAEPDGNKQLPQREAMERMIESGRPAMSFGDLAPGSGNQTQEVEDAGGEVDRRTRKYMAEHNVDYKNAMTRVLDADPELKRRYVDKTSIR